MAPTEDVRLDELEKEEWWDVARTVDPSISRQQFEADWSEFQKAKAAKQLS